MLKLNIEIKEMTSPHEVSDDWGTSKEALKTLCSLSVIHFEMGKEIIWESMTGVNEQSELKRYTLKARRDDLKHVLREEAEGEDLDANFARGEDNKKRLAKLINRELVRNREKNQGQENSMD